MGYEIEFYKTESGRIPVEEFIYSLQEKQSAKVVKDIRLLKEMGLPCIIPMLIPLRVKNMQA